MKCLSKRKVNKMEKYIEKHNDEKCIYCGYIEKDGEMTLLSDGAPISGIYFVCPNCHKPWEYEVINNTDIKMVKMTREEYDSLIGEKNEPKKICGNPDW